MLILPAIDLKGGKCVRLVQGRAADETVYDHDPVAVACRFAEQGARMLHLVDLDGAFKGKTANLHAIRRIRKAVALPLELGGGMRSLADVEGMLNLGIDEVIVGTMAVRTPEVLEEALQRFGGERVQLGVDAHEGRVAIAGWEERTELDAIAFARSWREKGVERVIFTDIARDGMMQGANVEAIQHFARGAGIKVTASGGITSPEELGRLGALEALGVERAIVGKALYEGTISLAEVC